APVARFSMDPLYVTTTQAVTVTFDGRKSCDALDNPELCDNTEDGDGCPSTCPGGIEYSWDIPGAVGAITPLKSNFSMVTASVRITRPVSITLTVTDCDGLKATKSLTLGVSVP
ncbi:hypothetical protein KJ865_00950, partial [Myxococcota bacterium]|nr:hypothetical protein [Myxococcota bacterium]